MAGDVVKLDPDVLLAVARDLNAIVVSLDRIGSANAERDRTELAAALLGFFEDWSVFEKLAGTRKLLNGALLAGADSEAERDHIEQQLDRGPYWPDRGASTDP